MYSDQTSVIKTPESPTGYAVHFVFEHPGEKAPWVMGDWMFSDEHHSSHWKSARVWPHQWYPGCFPHQLMGLKQTPPELLKNPEGKIDPKAFEFDWEILKLGMYPMERNAKTGLWEVTLPLPCGAYNYRFVTEMPDGNPLKMVTETDPSRRPLSYKDEQCNESTVYVPYDADTGCPDRRFELPLEGEDRGRIEWIDYADSTNPTETTELHAAVYLPYGYDPARPQPYKVLYLSHGGSENAASWIGKGSACNILDRRISEGRCEPLVVVMMNNEVLGWDNAGRCIPNLLHRLMPQIEARYHVRTDPSGCAFAGFSAGGFLAADLLAYAPERFGTIGVWSGGLRGSAQWESHDYTDTRIHIGAGRYDDAFYTFAVPLEDMLSAKGIDFTSYFPFGGHQWSVWRCLLDDLITRVF